MRAALRLRAQDRAPSILRHRQARGVAAWPGWGPAAGGGRCGARPMRAVGPQSESHVSGTRLSQLFSRLSALPALALSALATLASLCGTLAPAVRSGGARQVASTSPTLVCETGAVQWARGAFASLDVTRAPRAPRPRAHTCLSLATRQWFSKSESRISHYPLTRRKTTHTLIRSGTRRCHPGWRTSSPLTASTLAPVEYVSSLRDVTCPFSFCFSRLSQIHRTALNHCDSLMACATDRFVVLRQPECFAAFWGSSICTCLRVCTFRPDTFCPRFIAAANYERTRRDGDGGRGGQSEGHGRQPRKNSRCASGGARRSMARVFLTSRNSMLFSPSTSIARTTASTRPGVRWNRSRRWFSLSICTTSSRSSELFLSLS